MWQSLWLGIHNLPPLIEIGLMYLKISVRQLSQPALPLIFGRVSIMIYFQHTL